MDNLEYNYNTMVVLQDFYVGNGTNRFIKFDGTNVDIETGRLTAGSSVSIETPSFFWKEEYKFYKW